MPDSCALTRTTQGNQTRRTRRVQPRPHNSQHAAGVLPESGGDVSDDSERSDLRGLSGPAGRSDALGVETAGEVIGCGKLPSGDRYLAWLVWPWDELEHEPKRWRMQTMGRLL